MKIRFEKYNPVWKKDFEKINNELMDSIGFLNPKIEHIGSTSVEGLSAKPIIDILVGLPNENQLDQVIHPFLEDGCIYYQVYNESMPYRRFFVKHKENIGYLQIPAILTQEDEVPKSTEEHNLRLAHIHVLPLNSIHWTRHIAFRDYLRTHPEVKMRYEKLKEDLSTREWIDGNDYNQAKDAFLKAEEQKAVDLFENQQK